MKNMRVYVDTSVFGGVFDEEFKVASREFFNQVKAKYFSIVTLVIVMDEIQPAPEPIRNFFSTMTCWPKSPKLVVKH